MTRTALIALAVMCSLSLQGCDPIVEEYRASKDFEIVSVVPGKYAYAHLRDVDKGVDYKNAFVSMYCYGPASDDLIGSVVTLDMAVYIRESGKHQVVFSDAQNYLCG